MTAAQQYATLESPACWNQETTVRYRDGSPVSGVIISYNRLERLPGVIDTVLADPGTQEVVVILDASTDGLEEWVGYRAHIRNRAFAMS